MRFKSQTHTQDAHIDRYRTRYGQAPAVASEWDWPREDAPELGQRLALAGCDLMSVSCTA